MDVQASQRGSNLSKLGREEKEVFLGMLRPVLIFRPEERATAANTLGSQ
jgi:hypothetical protein